MTVIVVDKKRIKTCLKDYLSNVTWPETAPGYDSIQNCPQGYGGFARRMCIMLDGESPQWDRPDMSECVSYYMESIVRDVSVYFIYLFWKILCNKITENDIRFWKEK